jgi:aryl-alcohol dehydrogenase-like predicted oxidoreductase
MQYKSFGRTGLSVSRMCLGTGTFGKQTGEAEAFSMFDMAAEAGVNFIDTADMYPAGKAADERGGAEEITGRWLKGKRNRFIVGTKAGGAMGPASWDQGTSRKHLLDAMDASLRRLQVDHVDLYQVHLDDLATPLDETAEALDAIVRAGKARYIGVSNFLAYRLARALGRQDTLRLVRYVSAQPRYNLLFREIERDLLPLAVEENMAVIPFNPLAGGLLTNRYQVKDQPQTGRFSPELGQFGAMYQQRYWHEREFDTIEKLRAVAAQAGEPLARLATAWVLANPAITSVILGASRLEQLTDTLGAADYQLPEAIKAQFDEITAEYRRGDAGK